MLLLAGCSEIPQANGNIAFMGDSITYFWWVPRVNFGVPGDTTTEMLARYPNQVLGHNYKAVVILASTNDIRNTKEAIGPLVATAIGNIAQMAALADAEGMEVVLCDIPPIAGETARVVAMNAAIDSLASEHHYKLVDYYTPLAGHPEDFKDGLHPNDHGYWVMQTALTPVIPLDY